MNEEFTADNQIQGMPSAKRSIFDEKLSLKATAFKALVCYWIWLIN